jgi:hypothetical protein
MRLFPLALAVVVALVAVSSGIAVTANEIEEERRGGVGHAISGGHLGGGGDTGGGTGTGGGTVYGTHTSIGLMYPNGHSASKTKKKCNRFTNWFKRLFDKSIKKCPKKGEEDTETETTRRLRA